MTSWTRSLHALVGAVGLALMVASSAGAADCTQTSVGFTPLDDLGAALYMGQFQGGLYPGGSNDVPVAHQTEGVSRAFDVEPLAADGSPDPSGKYVLLSIGMSNTTQEFCSANSRPPCDAWTFTGQAAVDPEVEQDRLAIINGARAGEAAEAWEFPELPNYDRIRDERLAPAGLTETQVQAVWVKVATPEPQISLPDVNADAYDLTARMGNIARALMVRYPNLKIAFFSSRIYAGYATITGHPEPYAYETGLAVKWLIEAQIEQMAGGGVDALAGDLDHDSVAPWLVWGPYLWADGLTPRSDGLIWECADFDDDGTHPAQPGETKVGTFLLDFMLGSPFAMPWFRSTQPPSVTTEAASAISSTAATLNGSVNPNGSDTTAHFEYGLTPSYGSSTAATAIGAGTSFVAHSETLGGLACDTEYHFRAVASNADGTGNGADESFRTGPCGSFTLTVARSGSGAGTITSDPAGIDCGSDCTEDYAAGVTIALSPDAAPGSVFVGWTGAAECYDSQVLLAAPTFCEAGFALEAPDLHLAGMILSGTESFEACRSVSAGDTFEVHSPGDISLRAGEEISLRNGFAVHTGAGFTALIDSSLTCS